MCAVACVHLSVGGFVSAAAHDWVTTVEKIIINWW